MGADTWFYHREDEEAVKGVMKYCLTPTLMDLKTLEVQTHFLYFISIEAFTPLQRSRYLKLTIKTFNHGSGATDKILYGMMDSCIIWLLQVRTKLPTNTTPWINAATHARSRQNV